MRSIEVVQIELAGKKYSFIFTHKALRRAEMELNRVRGSRENEWIAIEGAISRGINGVSSGQSFPHLLTEILLWAGIADNDGSITPENIGDLIEDRSYVIAKIAEAIGKSYPTPDPAVEEVANGDRPLSGGPSSGASAE